MNKINLKLAKVLNALRIICIIGIAAIVTTIIAVNAGNDSKPAVVSAAPTQTATPTQTAAPDPTETPEPTQTPVPSETPVPTQTPAPTDKPAPEPTHTKEIRPTTKRPGSTRTRPPRQSPKPSKSNTDITIAPPQ